MRHRQPRNRRSIPLQIQRIRKRGWRVGDGGWDELGFGMRWGGLDSNGGSVRRVCPNRLCEGYLAIHRHRSRGGDKATEQG